MFALEITFQDGGSAPERVLVRRPFALIGGQKDAHVFIDDMQAMKYQIAIIKNQGRSFRVLPIASSESGSIPMQLEGVFEGHTDIKLDTVAIKVHSLDGDLILKENEPPDRAGVRVMRQSSSAPAPQFPAIFVRGKYPLTVSFSPDQTLYVGRSNQCLVRLESDEVSNKHARIGYESGSFWIEDLGSSNGTFVDGQQISGRTEFMPGIPVLIGRSTTILGVTNNEGISSAAKIDSDVLKRPSQQRYPVIVSVSEVARPARVVLTAGENLTIGRDPGNDMWLGAPHVSRRHCDVTLQKTGTVKVKDHSTNGTFYGQGILRNGEELDVSSTPQVLNFGGEITVALCFDQEQEEKFVESGGNPHVFLSEEDIAQMEMTEDDTGTIVDRDYGTSEASLTDRDSIAVNQGTVAFQKLVLNLTWPAKIMLIVGVAGAFILTWMVISLLLTF